MSKLYDTLSKLKRDGTLSLMETVAIAAACEHVIALPQAEKITLGTKVLPVLEALLKDELKGPSLTTRVLRVVKGDKK